MHVGLLAFRDTHISQNKEKTLTSVFEIKKPK